MLRSKLTKTYISQYDINASAQNLQNRARFSEPVKMSPNSRMLQLKHKNINISAEYQCFCMKPSEQGSFFLSWCNSQKYTYP